VRKQISAVLAGIALGTTATQASTLQYAAPVDEPTLLRELAAAEKKRETSSDSRRAEVRTMLEQAAGGGQDASELYKEALAETLSGDKGRGKWDANDLADLLRSEQLQAAVAFHARYLLIGLGLREPTQATADASFTYARDYARQFVQEKFVRLPDAAGNLLFRPAAESPVSKWLFLGGHLPAEDSWEPVAGNLGGILEKNVRPLWRKSGDPRLASTWDLEIEFEEQRLSSHGSDFEKKYFESVAKPRLIFRRACDRALQGQPNMSTKEVLGLLKSFPHHPDWPVWAAKLRASLAPAGQGAPPKPAG